MADLFDVVADPTRRELLRALLQRANAEDGPAEASVGELVAELSLSQPTVSKHLKTLREASLVTVREQGQHRYYRIDPAPLTGIAEWLGAFLPQPEPEPVAVDEAPAPAADPVAVVAAAAPAPLPDPLRRIAVRLGAVAATSASRIRGTR